MTLSEHSSHVRAPRRDLLFGLPVTNVSMNDAVALVAAAATRDKVTSVFFVNAHCVNVAYSDPMYRRVLASATLLFADGIGVQIAGRVLGCPIVANVNGTDMFPRICERMQETGLPMFLLGGKPGVADRVRAWVERQYPGLSIVGVRDGYFTEAETPAIVEGIRRSGAKILLVAMGVPKQELWIQRHQLACEVPVALGVGGLFDFYSGQVRRAPRWMRDWGLEWLYRLSQEPTRLWRRYLLGNCLFLARVLAEKRSGS